MKWSNVRLIFLREFRDQLRDRRTLFTIAVLPLLLYPLLGMSLFQIAQFLREHPTRVWIVNAQALPATPPLLSEGGFSTELATSNANRLLQVTLATADELATDELATDELATDALATDEEGLRALARKKIDAGDYDAVVLVPANLAEQMQRFRQQLQEHGRPEEAGGGPGSGVLASGVPERGAELARATVPGPEILTNDADDRSQIAGRRVADVLREWREQVVAESLRASGLPVAAVRPFNIVSTDVSREEVRRAAVWSKILPFVVLIWALTGAFYPAIDLCAGEKERGTLETLLSSPAQRSEIVWGKLLTIMVFSMATSLLNLASMGLTGTFIIRQMERMGTGAPIALGVPPLAAAGWLVLALVPIAALFSALSLAVAAFARSSKEGQYYLMPLLMISLPLMMVALLPSAELDLGTSLIPVSGMMLLLQALVEGRYAEAWPFVFPVFGVTGACCLLAIRWAIDQFNNEAVLFRENERWGLGLWLRHLVRDREATPTLGQAVLCGLLLLVIRFFAGFVLPAAADWPSLAVMTVVTQIALVATPALLMTIMLTRSPRRTLLLQTPRMLAVPAAILLAITLHPLVRVLGQAIEWLYPMRAETLQALQPLLEGIQHAPWWQVLLVIAVTPAICEEVAFRGFILSGVRHLGHKWTAIVVSSVFFGVAHGILQQSLATTVLGIVIGYLAVQTGSLLPCMAFHMTNNALSVLVSRVTPDVVVQQPWLRLLLEPGAAGDYHVRLPVTMLAAFLSLALLLWFRSLPYHRYAEEQLQEALDQRSSRAVAR